MDAFTFSLGPVHDGFSRRHIQNIFRALCLGALSRPVVRSSTTGPESHSEARPVPTIADELSPRCPHKPDNLSLGYFVQLHRIFGSTLKSVLLLNGYEEY